MFRANCTLKSVGMAAGLLACATLPALAQLPFTIGSNFTGSTFNQDSQFVPPDSMGAVGTNSFVELINGHYNVYDKVSGTRLQSKTDVQFWSDAGVTVGGGQSSDPRIVFDRSSQRWFASGIDVPNGGSSTNNFLLAVSNTADPTQGFRGLTIAADTGGSNFGDFPTLGINGDGVYLGASAFTADTSANFVGETFVSIPKADLLGATPTAAHLTRFDNLSPNNVGFSLQAEQALDGETGPAHILATLPVSNSNQLFVNTISNASTPSAIFQSGSQTVATYNSPPDAQQPGTTQLISTNDSRFSGATARAGNSLWQAQSITINGRAGVRWYQLDAATGTVIQSGQIANPILDYYFPSIAANRDGTVVIGFSGSGATQYASSYAVVGSTLNGRTIFSVPQLLKAGAGSYSVVAGGENRWGDYSATTLDPNDPNSFWTIQEYASGTNTWSTQISQLRVAAVPEPSLCLAFGIGLVAIGGVRKRQGRNKQRRALQA